MPKLSDLKTADQVHAEHLRDDPEYRAEHERTRFANSVAIRVIQYRADHDVTQTGLARKLGMKQSAIARLEAGDHEPSLATLRRLSHGLGIEFHIDVTPESLQLRATA